MPVEKNKTMVSRLFEDTPYYPKICDEFFASRIPWHALYHTDRPDLIRDPQTEKTASAGN